MIFSPNLIVMLKILSSGYQLYACGKIFRMPRFWTNIFILQEARIKGARASVRLRRRLFGLMFNVVFAHLGIEGATGYAKSFSRKFQVSAGTVQGIAD